MRLCFPLPCCTIDPGLAIFYFCATAERRASSSPASNKTSNSAIHLSQQRKRVGPIICGTRAWLRLSGWITTARGRELLLLYLIGMRFALCARPFFSRTPSPRQSTPSSSLQQSSTTPHKCRHHLSSRPKSGEQGMGRRQWARRQ